MALGSFSSLELEPTTIEDIAVVAMIKEGRTVSQAGWLRHD